MTLYIDGLLAIDKHGNRVPLPDGEISLSGYMINSKIFPDKISYTLKLNENLSFINHKIAATQGFREDTLKKHKLD